MPRTRNSEEERAKDLHANDLGEIEAIQHIADVAYEQFNVSPKASVAAFDGVSHMQSDGLLH